MIWEKIQEIKNEDVIKLLGKELVAFRGRGYTTETTTHEFYVLVVGNGTIIQIHNNSYVVSVIRDKEKSSQRNGEENPNELLIYQIQPSHSKMNEDYWMKEMKKQIEKDFVL